VTLAVKLREAWCDTRDSAAFHFRRRAQVSDDCVDVLQHLIVIQFAAAAAPRQRFAIAAKAREEVGGRLSL